MENQHRKIKGYRELTQEEIDLMNEIKEKGIELGELFEKIKNAHLLEMEDGNGPDMRWANIGRTHLQQGLMALTRSVAKPDLF